MPSVIHDRTSYAYNRAEVSHQPTRQRERQMRDFKSPNQAQRFLQVHGLIQNLFRVGRHRLRAVDRRLLRARSFAEWIASRRQGRQPPQEAVMGVVTGSRAAAKHRADDPDRPMDDVACATAVDAFAFAIRPCGKTVGWSHGGSTDSRRPVLERGLQSRESDHAHEPGAEGAKPLAIILILKANLQFIGHGQLAQRPQQRQR